jgi:hypothetical protein
MGLGGRIRTNDKNIVFRGDWRRRATPAIQKVPPSQITWKKVAGVAPVRVNIQAGLLPGGFGRTGATGL